MTTHIVCPIALHPSGAPLRMPARVPLGDAADGAFELVTCTIDASIADTSGHAARALYDLTGLETRSALTLGASDDIAPDQLWHFALCRLAPPVREAWQHLDRENGGQLRRFAWVSLDSDAAFCDTHARAFDWIRATL